MSERVKITTLKLGTPFSVEVDRNMLADELRSAKRYSQDYGYRPGEIKFTVSITGGARRVRSSCETAQTIDFMFRTLGQTTSEVRFSEP